MATFSYTQIDDYALKDFVTYQLTNVLIESHRYIAEDILGIDQGDSDGFIPSISMNNDATHGGAIFFNGGSSKYLKADAAGTYLECAGFHFNVKTPHLIQGDRMVLPFSRFGSGNADHYVTTISSRSGGFKTPKDGSILSLTFAANNVNLDTFTVQAEVHVNGSTVLNSSGLAFSGDAFLSTATTQARNVDQFSAGDYIDAFINFTSGANLIYYGVIVEIIMDT